MWGFVGRREFLVLKVCGSVWFGRGIGACVFGAEKEKEGKKEGNELLRRECDMR